MSNEVKQLLVGDVARLLDVSTATVRAWDANGKLVPRGRTAGNKRYYLAEDVEAFKQSGAAAKYTRRTYTVNAQ